MKVIKTDKHYMAEPDFEIDHYKDASYPPVASHYHEFYEIFLFVSGNADYVVHDKMFQLAGRPVDHPTCHYAPSHLPGL